MEVDTFISLLLAIEPADTSRRPQENHRMDFPINSAIRALFNGRGPNGGYVLIGDKDMMDR